MTGKDLEVKRSYLFVVASSCQMYSGTGTAIFDWIRFARNEFEFHILMDDSVESNWTITRDFCASNGITFHLCKELRLPGAPDTGVRGVSDLLVRRRFDVLECVSWANAATNLHVLQAIPQDTLLVYTPHTQPEWTLSEPGRYPLVQHTFREMLERADCIFLDSQNEADLPLFGGRFLPSMHVVPLGIDGIRFHLGEARAGKNVISVCDFREHRKRADLFFAAAALALELDPGIQFTIAGKGSDVVHIPAPLCDSIRRLGYISEGDLIALYQNSSVFVLLSDYEAFGLPIAEALCCGTPVLLNTQPAMQSLFSNLPGAYFVPNTNTHEAARAIVSIASSAIDYATISRAARETFGVDRTYGRKLEILNATLRQRQRGFSRAC